MMDNNQRIETLQTIQQLLKRLPEEPFLQFCQMYYPDVFRQFASGILRGHQERLLLEHAERKDGLLTLAEQLADLPPLFTDDDLNKYLTVIQEEYGRLRFLTHQQKPVPLERVYVALKGDAMNAAEREAEYNFFRQHVDELHQLGLQTMPDNAYQRTHAISKAMTRIPYMKMLTARDFTMQFGERKVEILSLAVVVQQHQHVVILGDPGSGKTTLCKWLVLQFAKSMQAGKEMVRVPADLVQPDSTSREPLDLGEARLPIFIPIGQYAKARFQSPSSHDDLNLTLETFIHQARQFPAEKWHNAGLSPTVVGAIMHHYLSEGRALVVLDGLDEVGEPTQRIKVMEAVKAFIQTHGQNQLLLTSRIVGYQFQPLTHLDHYTVEEMGEQAIRAFCRAWLTHVAEAETLEEDVERLETAIFDSHAGVQALAGNPLLLTILAQVYWQRPSRTLPTRRVALFEEAEKAFFQQRQTHWQAVGISRQQLRRALGVVAFDLHRHEATGFATRQDVEAAIRSVLPDAGQVEAVLQAARDVSGFLIARGEDAYGFIHQGVQEYFAARHLLAAAPDPVHAFDEYLLEPTWREPVILGLGMVSSRDQAKVMQHLLDYPDPVGDYLPRRELVAVAACGECKTMPEEIVPQLTTQLIGFLARRGEKEQAQVLQVRVIKAMQTLYTYVPQLILKEIPKHIIHENVEHRLATLQLIQKNDWYNHAIVGAILHAYRQYGSPIALLTHILHKTSKYQPQWLTHQPTLILKKKLSAQPKMWYRIMSHKGWRQLLQALLLPVGASFTIDAIHRPAYHHEAIWQAMQEPDLETSFIKLMQQTTHWLSQGGRMGQEASLILASQGLSLEETNRWVSLWKTKNNGGINWQNSIIQIWYLTNLEIDYIRNLDRALDRALNRAHNDAVQRALNIAIDITRDLTRDPEFSRNLDHVLMRGMNASVSEYAHALDPELDPELDSASKLALELARLLFGALKRDLDLAGDYFFAPAPPPVHVLDLARDLARDLDLAHFFAPAPPDFEFDLQLDLALAHLHQLQEIWQTISQNNHASTSSMTPQIEAKFQQLQGVLVPLKTISQTELWQTANRLLRAWRDLHTTTKPDITIVAGEGATLVTALQSVDDEQRQQAISSSKASTLVEESIENLAQMTLMYEAQDQSEVFLRALRRIPQFTIRYDLKREVADFLQKWGQQSVFAAYRPTLIRVLGHWQRNSIDTFTYLRDLSLETMEEKQAQIEAIARHSQEEAKMWLANHLDTIEGQIGWVRWHCHHKPTPEALLTLIQESLPAQSQLTALWQAGNDDDIWQDNNNFFSKKSHHRLLTRTARLHLNQHSQELPMLLGAYVKALQGESWESKRILLAILSACLEEMPITVQNVWSNQSYPRSLESCLVQSAKNANSHNVRRFALTGLSYLRTVAPAVVPVLIDGLLDNVEVVRQDAVEACRRFQQIEPAVLDDLIPHLTSESIQVSGGVGQMLGALGRVAVGQNNPLRKKIMVALVEALKDESSQRTYQGEQKLEDIFYESLLQVAGVPA